MVLRIDAPDVRPDAVIVPLPVLKVKPVDDVFVFLF